MHKFIFTHRVWRIKRILIAVSLAAIVAQNCSFNKPRMYLRDPDRILWDSTLSVLCLPVDTVKVEYKDNTQVHPDTLFTDSFFLDAANNLLLFETMKLFPQCKMHSRAEQHPDSQLVPKIYYSRLTHDTAHFESMSQYAQKLAVETDIDLICIPYSASIYHVTYKPEAWRGGGPSYERPVSFSATSTFHAQIWDKTGQLVYEKIGKSDAGRPVGYTLFEREQKENEEVTKFAKHFYAPPLVRALYLSVKNAMSIRR